jgi:hypothetical protein
MQPAQPLAVASESFVLKPGENRMTFTADTSAGYPGDVGVIVSRLCHLEQIPGQ